MSNKEFKFGFAISAFLDGKFQASFGMAGKILFNINNKIKDNQKIVKELSNAQKNGVINAESYSNALAKINPEIQRLSRNQKVLISQQNRINGIRNNMRNHGADAIQYGSMAWSMGELVKPAIEFESSMADVKKVVDFEYKEQFKDMENDILNLSTRIPIAAEGLAQIVAAGGQSGIAREDLLKFAEAAARMGVAFDVTADQAGDMMAKWRTAFKMNQSEVVELADKINYLGNTTAASAPLISDVVTRIGPLGSIGGVASGEIAALGASMVGSGVQSEVAATGIKNLILALVSGESATKSQANAFAQLGLNAEDMAVAMQKDAKGAILSVLKALEKLAPEKRASVMAELFGKESLTAIGPLLSNLKSVEDNLKKVGDSAQYVGSMENEFAERAATTKNSLTLMANAAYKAKVSLCSGLLPAITPLVSKLSAFAIHIGNIATQYPKFTAVLVGGLAAIFTGATIINGIMWAVNGLNLAIIGTKSAYTIATMALSKYNLATKMGTVLSYAFNISQKSVGAAVVYTKSCFSALSVGVMKLWGILLANPWIALATLAVGAGIMIYQNWDAIKQWFTTLWDNPALALRQFVDGIKEYFTAAYNWVQEKWEGIKNFLSTPIFGKVNIAAQGVLEENGVAQNAYGGIYGKGAFLTTFAEKSGESAIPHTPTPRNIGLLAETNRIMGNPLNIGLQNSYPISKVASINNYAEYSTADNRTVNNSNTEYSTAINNYYKTINSVSESIPNIGLLAETNRIMGNSLGSGSVNATFAPNITVQGSADTAQIDNILTQKMREFKAMLEELRRRERRLSYA